MNKTTAEQLLGSLGGSKPNCLVRFGYLLKDGSYATVEGFLVSWVGRPAEDYRGVRVRVISTSRPELLVGRDDAVVPFNLTRIQQGEQQRLAARAERAANGTATSAEMGAATLFAAPKPPTHRQIRYAMDLGPWLEADELAAMSRDEVSKLIEELRSNHGMVSNW